MRNSFILTAFGLAVATPPVTAPAQPAQPSAEARKLDARRIVAEVRRLIAERYVLAERRPVLDAVLAQGLASGRYGVSDPAALAGRINADLKRVGRDKHLSFTFDPERASRPAANKEPAPDPSGVARHIRAANHGVTELRLLPGNVRYMAYDNFYWTGSKSATALDTAMRFLADGDAIIIDVGRNQGGSADAAEYLISHFLPANQMLFTYYGSYQGGPARTIPVSTVPDLPAGRVIGKPLYVLTSSASFSAAEAFAGMVGGHRIGEVIGENTAGGGFANEVVPMNGLFVLSISTGRIVLTSTGRDWEGAGIAPTIPAPYATALDSAHVHALRRLGTRAAESDRPAMEAMAEGIEARARPGTPAAPLQAYAGSYGERSVLLEEGKLWYRRAAGPRRQLVPLGGNRFTFGDDPSLRIVFHAADARVTAMEVGPATGPSLGRYERTR
jgi:hypothetical protein